MDKEKLLSDIIELFAACDMDIEAFCDLENKKNEKYQTSFKLDRSSYYPFMVGYLHAGLRHLIEDVKDGFYEV